MAVVGEDEDGGRGGQDQLYPSMETSDPADCHFGTGQANRESSNDAQVDRVFLTNLQAPL